MLRPRRPEDLEACVALLRDVHEADGYPLVWPADPASWLAGTGDLATWVAEEDGTILGHLSLRRLDAARSGSPWHEALPVPVEQRAVVSRFFVSTRARRLGIGDALMTRAEQHAAEEKLRLVLDVAVENRTAIAFYQRRGWRRVGTGELPLSADPWVLSVAVFVLDPGSRN
ncbi:MAG TPA: GNAT family N-acetyltransferase [Solirubrobacteraceae bacterium]|nr:GNAT family N-acetyltransferase [Solirubrobacteraceae bacterium]